MSGGRQAGQARQARQARRGHRIGLAVSLGALALATACQSLLGIDGDRPLASTGPDTDAALPIDGRAPPPAPLDATGGADHASVDATDEGSASDATLPSSPDGSISSTAQIANGRADETVEAMLLHFWDPASDSLYATSLQGSTALADLTSFTQAWDAVIDATERYRARASAASATPRFFGTIETLYDSQAALGIDSTTNPTLPFDQELNLILAMIRAYDVTQQSGYLLTARGLFTDIQNNAWDTTCCTIASKIPFGGIWKDRVHSKKSTAANAAAAIAAARLAVRTTGSASASYYSFATRVYDYWSQYMVAPSGQVYDSVSASGEADAATSGVDTTTAFTYDQGLLIGAAVEVGQAMQDVEDASTTTLPLANLMAGYLLQNEVATVSVPVAGGTSTGAILSDGDDAMCTGECALYKGFAARYLGELYAADPSHAEYAAVLERSADAAYALARDPSSHLYGVDWASSFTGAAAAVLGATSSAAMVLSAAASISGPPAAIANPAAYEATEGVITHVGLDTTFGNFTGWGYVTSPGTAASEGVTFPLTVPKTDLYALNFFYRFETTNTAVRDVIINGGTATSTTFVPITAPGWTGNPLVVVNATLNANALNSVAVVYDMGNGSSGAVNIDQLQWSENLLPAQPGASDWDSSFATPPTITAAASPPGATTWTGTETLSGMDGEWIKIYPQQKPFNVNFQTSQNYVAAITLTGSNSTPYYLDIYNGVTDLMSTEILLTSTPQTLQSPVFTVGSGAKVEFQLRVPYNGGTPVAIDVTMSSLAIYLVPTASP